MIESTIQRVTAGENLTMDQAAEVIDLIMQGSVGNDHIGQLLLGLREKGETVEEIAGAATALRKHMSPIRSTREQLVDTCGTGGDGSDTFNISTAAAIVTAACGVPVAKHGNRKVSSKTGSADVLTSLGVNVGASIETVERCLDEVGICFCFAPLFHASMKNVAEVRKSLGVPTIFNMLGPLCNPAGAGFQVMGVGKPELRERIASALQLLGTARSVVVHGTDGLCEISNAAGTSVSIVTPESIEQTIWSPADFGCDVTTRESITAQTPEESAAKISQVLAGQKGGPRDVVIMNAAAALWLHEDGREQGNDQGKEQGEHVQRGLTAAAHRAAEAIDSGRAAEILQLLAKASNNS